MTRNVDSDAAKSLAATGAEIVKGDLGDAASIETALTGAWGAFAVQNTWEAGVEGEEAHGRRCAAVARKVGVQRFVYSSVGSTHRQTGIPHLENKWRPSHPAHSHCGRSEDARGRGDRRVTVFPM